jgi:hypothetical protein
MNMRPRLNLKGQIIDTDPENESYLVKVWLDRIPSDGITRPRRILTAAKHELAEIGYDPLEYGEFIPDDDQQFTIAMTEREFALTLRVTEFHIDKQMIETDMCLLNSRMDLS